MSDRVLSLAAVSKIVLLLTCAALIAGGATGCADPDPLEESAAVATADAELGACDPVRVDLWVRFWRDGEEVSCAQAVADGFDVEAGILGGQLLTTQRGWCASQVQTDPARRIGTGVWTITNGVAGRNLSAWVTGGYEEHTIPITQCGRTGSVMLSIVLPGVR